MKKIKLICLLGLFLFFTGNAAIVYKSIHKNLKNYDQSFDIDLDGDNDFYMDYNYYGNSSYMIRCANSTSFVAFDMQNYKVKEYSEGSGLGTHTWLSGEYLIDNFIGKDKYIGIRFSSGNNIYYGWINVYDYLGYMYVAGYAYEDVSGQSIKMGDRGATGITHAEKPKFALLNCDPHQIAFKDCSEFDKVVVFNLEGKILSEINNPDALQNYYLESTNCIALIAFFRKEKFISAQRHYLR